MTNIERLYLGEVTIMLLHVFVSSVLYSRHIKFSVTNRRELSMTNIERLYLGEVTIMLLC